MKSCSRPTENGPSNTDYDLDYADDIWLYVPHLPKNTVETRPPAYQRCKSGTQDQRKHTKLIRMGTNCHAPLRMDDVLVDDVDKFCYLGGILCKDRGTEQDVRTRINTARQAYYSIRNAWHSSQLSISQTLYLQLKYESGLAIR